jgi:NTP pyrophosphatase (non-canonical NTP hydrolase)
MKSFPQMVQKELSRARKKYPAPIPTAHDAFGKILEEVYEFFDEVRKKERLWKTKKNRRAMCSELVQIAGLAQRAAEDLRLMT